MKNATKDKAITDTAEYLSFRLEESASRAAFLAESETAAADYVGIKYGAQFNADELDEITEAAYSAFCARSAIDNQINHEGRKKMKTETMNNIVAYIGTIWNDIQGMTEEEIRNLVESDIKLMGEDEATFTKEHLEEIVSEAFSEIA